MGRTLGYYTKTVTVANQIGVGGRGHEAERWELVGWGAKTGSR